MDFVESVRLILRRWLVFFGILIPVGVLSFLYVQATPPKYKATANVAFVAPTTLATSAPGSNPLTPTDVSLMVHDALSSSSTAQILVARGDSGYTVGEPTNNASPLMTLEATTGSSASALKTVQDLINAANQQSGIRQEQVGVAKKYWNKVVLVTGPGPVTLQAAKKVRAAAALGILGVILAIVASFIADSLLSRRKSRAMVVLDAQAALDDQDAEEHPAEPEQWTVSLSSKRDNRTRFPSEALG